jgi:ABC-type sugar transport system substrate-binding protein
MAVALKVLKGEKVPPKVLLPTVRVTKDNVNSVQPAF